jgi:AICAR transformylase/IMP cyclohydrolase PurH
MKRIVRLTESDLTRIVRRVITESKKEYRVVLLSKQVYDETNDVDDAIKQYSEETDGKTFEHRGSALRHAETLYDENPDNDIMFVVVDENNEGYGAVPGIIDSPLSRFATGFNKGY